MPYGDYSFDEPSGQWYTGDAGLEENWLPMGETPYPQPPDAGQEYTDFWNPFWSEQPAYQEPQGWQGYGDYTPAPEPGPGPGPGPAPGPRNQGPNNKGPGYQLYDYEAAKAQFGLQVEQLKLQYAMAKMNQTYQSQMDAIRAGDQRAAQKLEVDRQSLMQWAQQAHAKLQLAEQQMQNTVQNQQQEQRISASNVMANPRPIARKLSLLGVNI